MKNINLKLIILLLCPLTCLADDLLASSLDKLVTLFQGASENWVNPMQSIAFQIFAILFVPNTCWVLIKKFLENDYGRMWAILGIRIVSAGFFLYWIYHPALFFAIVQFFSQAGAKASNFNFNPNGTFTLKPSTIINYYQVIDFSVNKALSGASITDFGLQLMVTIQEIIVELALIIMALILMITLLESYIVTCGGICLLGFAGSDWTISYFQSFLKYTIAVGVKFMVICLLMGVFQGVLTATMSGFTQVCNANTCSLSSLAHVFAQASVTIIVITYLAYKVPEIASSMLSGTINTNFAGLATAASGILAASKGGAGSIASAGGLAGKMISASSALTTGKSAGEWMKHGAQAIKDKASGNNSNVEGSMGSGSKPTMAEKASKAWGILKGGSGNVKSGFGQMANAAQHGNRMSQSLGNSNVETPA